MIELLKAFGRGQLKHDAAQAAAWYLNSDVSWADLSAKRQGTVRSVNRPPYFSTEAIRAGMAYASEAQRLAQLNTDEYRREYARLRDAREKDGGSAARSTTEMEGTDTESGGESADARDAADEADAADG